MEKPADADHPIHELIRRRWSPRAFADRPVEPDKILSLLEAARWAPSSRNEQPWSYVVATRDDADEFERALECLVDGNREWARNAPLLILTFAKKRFEYKDRPNRYARHDVGLASANLVLQALELGLCCHQMAGIRPEVIRDTYGVPETHEPVTAIAVGYPGDPDDLPEDRRERELARRSRKSLREFVFAGDWGRPSPLIDES